MAEYRIVPPTSIRIRGMQQATDIRGLHTLFKNEGCIESENKFSDEEKAIALDNIQTRLAQKDHTNKQASADMLLCIANNKYLLADAKFRQENVKNISPTELRLKLEGSKSIVLSDDITFVNAFYVLFRNNILTASQQRWLKQKFDGSPTFRFVNAQDFRYLFE